MQVALVGWLPLAFVAFAIGLDQRSLAHRIQDDPLSVTLAEVRASDHRADVLNRIFLGCLVVTGILFIAWFRRAYRNLDGLHAPRRFGPG